MSARNTPSGVDLLKALRDHFSTDQFIGTHDILDVLDSVFGADWQVEHIPGPDGKLCCRLGIRIDGEWRWRSNGGDGYPESFRHAAEMWGIGRLVSAGADAAADDDEDDDPNASTVHFINSDQPLKIVRPRLLPPPAKGEGKGQGKGKRAKIPPSPSPQEGREEAKPHEGPQLEFEIEQLVKNDVALRSHNSLKQTS